MVQFKNLAAHAAFVLFNLAVSHAAVVQDDTYFYGQSPPVYPTPDMIGTGEWERALSQARSIVSQMSLEEKVSLTGGLRNSTSGCAGDIPAISRLGFPGMCLQDGPNGVKGTELVNGYPSGIHLGARYENYERGLRWQGSSLT